MLSKIGARCSRARHLLLGTTSGNKMMTISSYSRTGGSISRSFLPADASHGSGGSIFTRQFNVRRRNPWDVSRKSTHFFKHLTAFVSDFSPTPIQNSVSMVLCLTGMLHWQHPMVMIRRVQSRIKKGRKKILL